jgi:hypothetical protein
VEEELRRRVMRYTFDLSGDGMRRFGFFPEAVAALSIPATLPSTLSALVWGVVFREPEHDLDFCDHLPPDVRAALPARLYLSGWGVLTCQNVCRGEVTISPYRPGLLVQEQQFLTDREGKPLQLSQVWPGPAGSDASEYLFSMGIEQPFGFMSLKVTTTGPVQLSVDPRDLVTEEQVAADPGRYGYDYARTRQLRNVLSL